MAKYIPTFNELPEEQQTALVEQVVAIMDECALLNNGEGSQQEFENRLQIFWNKQRVQDFPELYNTDNYSEFYDEEMGTDVEGIRERLTDLCTEIENHVDSKTSSYEYGFGTNFPTGYREW